MAIARLDLSGSWEFKEFPCDARRMRDLEGDNWRQCQVPGSIYTNLMESGVISGKELAANPEDFAWVSDKPWVYRKRFNVSQEMLECGRVELVFDGLDTISHIWLNDKLIGKTDNMFIGHRFDVGGLLKADGNVVTVKFLPAVAEGKRLNDRYGSLDQLHSGCDWRSYVRKGQYQFGWDFCPSLPGCGIYRGVGLEGSLSGRIADVAVRTIDCNEYYADVRVAVSVQAGSGIDMRCRLKVSGHGIELAEEMHIRGGRGDQSTVMRIELPKMWWPRGYGRQELYKLEAILIDGDEVIDEMDFRFGIRSSRVNRSKDEYGESFEFVINDKPVYVKGATWMPMSIFPGRETRSDYERDLRRVAAANINMLRIWGGGNYESEDFYELCDELGIMIWQDFMFASACYPDRGWFMDNVTVELDSVIRRLRNHCCVVLWCGNSECEHLHQSGRFGVGRKFYGKDIYEKLIPSRLSELDPEREYIRTSPFGRDGNVNTAAEGTFDQRQIWDDFKRSDMLVSDAGRVPRFVAGVGFQSLPNASTVDGFGEGLGVGSAGLEKHNYQHDGNSRMVRYLFDRFGMVCGLDDFVYLTQLSHAREIKRYVEYLRVHNKVNRGIVLDQIMDCFGAISSSAIDANDEPKALYYYMRRFFAPVVVSVQQDSSSQLHGTAPGLCVFVVNDSEVSVTGILRYELIDLEEGRIDELELPVSIGAFSISSGFKVPRAIVRPDRPDRSVLRVVLEGHRGVYAENTYLYLPDKYITWPGPQISSCLDRVTQSQWKLSLQSDVMVKDLCVSFGSKAIVNENFIDVFAGKSYEFTIKIPSEPDNVEDSLKFYHVRHRG